MPKKRIRVGLLGGSILLLTASRPTKPDTTEVTAEGSMGQLEDKELAGSHTYPATRGGCGGGSPARTVRVYRHYEEKQAGGTLRVVHTTASEKTVSAEVSAYEAWRTRDKILVGNSDVEVNDPDYSKRWDAGTVIRLGRTKKKAHWELGVGLYQVKDKMLLAPSGMVRLGSAGPAYAFADVLDSSILPLGSYASTGLGFALGENSLEGKILYGPKGTMGTGLEGEVPLGRRLRFKLGGTSYSRGEAYEQWQAYSGLTLVAGGGKAKDPVGSAATPVKKKRWIDQPTSSPYLNY